MAILKGGIFPIEAWYCNSKLSLPTQIVSVALQPYGILKNAILHKTGKFSTITGFMLASFSECMGFSRPYLSPSL